jgi:hypothetical protein
MRSKNNDSMIPQEVIISKIYFIREQKVMIDRDLAELYGVETRALNQAVRRNMKRFPEDFMFQMTAEEMKNWKSQIVISNKEKMGLRKPPLAFTEQGVAMLSSVLNSETAILVNIQIIRTFTKIRKIIENHKTILEKLEKLELQDKEHENSILLIFEYLKQLEKLKQTELEQQNRKEIGFRRNSKTGKPNASTLYIFSKTNKRFC